MSGIGFGALRSTGEASLDVLAVTPQVGSDLASNLLTREAFFAGCLAQVVYQFGVRWEVRVDGD